jgi:hypothetical protein
MPSRVAIATASRTLFPLSAASDCRSPLLLALLGAQHPSHPVEPGLLVGLVGLIAVNVFS